VGLGPGYGIQDIGGQSAGSSDRPASTELLITDQSYGRDMRNTKFPINSVIPMLMDNENDIPLAACTRAVPTSLLPTGTWDSCHKACR